MTTSISCILFNACSGTNRIILVNCQARATPDDLLFTPRDDPYLLNWLHQRLDQVMSAEQRDIAAPLCDFLNHVFYLMHLLNGDNHPSDKRLAIMLADGSTTLGADVTRVANEFITCNITLAIVTQSALVFDIWDHYHTAARLTGGEQMYLAKAPGILSHTVWTAINEDIALRQAFLSRPSGEISTVVNSARTNEESDDANADGEFFESEFFP